MPEGKTLTQSVVACKAVEGIKNVLVQGLRLHRTPLVPVKLAKLSSRANVLGAHLLWQDVGMLGKGAQPKSWFRLGRGKSPLKPTAVGSYQNKKSEILSRYGEKNV